MSEANSARNLKGKTGIRRLVNATRYSWAGLKAAFKSEEAFRQEVIITAIMTPVALLLPVSWLESALMIAALFFWMTVEILNSALEAVVDRISMEIHPLSGKAKDMGSAAVLLAMIATGIIWLACLLPHIPAWLN